VYSETNEQVRRKDMCPTPAIESKIQNLLNEIEVAQERGNLALVTELRNELDELCNMAEAGEF